MLVVLIPMGPEALFFFRSIHSRQDITICWKIYFTIYRYCTWEMSCVPGGAGLGRKEKDKNVAFSAFFY